MNTCSSLLAGFQKWGNERMELLPKNEFPILSLPDYQPAFLGNKLYLHCRWPTE